MSLLQQHGKTSDSISQMNKYYKMQCFEGRGCTLLLKQYFRHYMCWKLILKCKLKTNFDGSFLIKRGQKALCTHNIYPTLCFDDSSEYSAMISVIFIKAIHKIPNIISYVYKQQISEHYYGTN